MPQNTPPQPDTETPDEPAAGSTRFAPPAPLAGNRFFAWLRSLNLTREPGWIGGVASGIAARLGIDPLIVRGIIVVVAVLGGPALLLYAAAWLLLPDQNDKIHLEEVFRGRIESAIAGIGTLVLLSMLPVTQGFWFAGSAFWGEPSWGQSAGRALWTLVLLGLIVWFVVWVARRAPGASAPTVTPATTDARPDTIPSESPAATAAFVAEPTAPPAGTASAEEYAAWREQQAQWKAQNDAFRARQANEQFDASVAAHELHRRQRAAQREVERLRYARTRSNPIFSFVVIGLSLVAGGVVALTLGRGELAPAAVLGGLGATLAVLALGIIINGARGRRPGGAQGLAVIVLIPLLVAGLLPHSPNVSYTESAAFAPVATSDFDNYFVGVGDATLDLRDFYDDADPGFERQTSVVTLTVGVGDVTVIVPADEYVGFGVATGFGTLSAPGSDVADAGTWDRTSGTYAPEGSTRSLGGDQRSIHVNVNVWAGDVRFERAAPTTTEGSSE